MLAYVDHGEEVLSAFLDQEVDAVLVIVIFAVRAAQQYFNLPISFRFFASVDIAHVRILAVQDLLPVLQSCQVAGERS